MNALATRSEQPSRTYSGQGELTIELAKMLALVAPTSMTAEQQEMWLRAAVDALEGIRADEVEHVATEVKRSVIRHNQIVPEIAKLVAARRAERGKQSSCQFALPDLPSRQPGPPLDVDEIKAMPKWLRGMGLRVGFLKRDGDRIVDAGL